MKTWKIALILSYISIASASGVIITPALPNIETTFSLSKGSLEWIISIFLLGYLIGQAIYAPITNKIGRLNTLRVGFLINIIGIIICLIGAYTLSYKFILLGRFITALGASAGLVCTFILLNELLTLEKARQAISFAVISFTLGIGIAVLLGGLITENLHWLDCFWLLLFHGIIALCSTWLLDEPKTTHTSSNILKILHEYFLAIFDKKLSTFSLFVGAVSVFSYCFAATGPVFATKTLGITATQYGYLNIFNMLGMFIGAIFARKIIGKYNNIRLLILASSVISVCVMLMYLFNALNIINTAIFFSLSFIIFFATSISFPAASFLASTAIENKANASGAMNLINIGSAVLAVTIMGYIPATTLNQFVIVMLSMGAICLIKLKISRI